MTKPKFTLTEKDLEAFFAMPDDGWFTANEDWRWGVTHHNARLYKLMNAGFLERKTHPDGEPDSPYRDVKFRKLYVRVKS